MFAAPAYPTQDTTVVAYADDIAALLTAPAGLVETAWPPDQFRYLSHYLTTLGCRTLVIEQHYIDRDFMDDVALFYVRNLRPYPNSCQRIHFFSEAFDAGKWRELVLSATTDRAAATERLQSSYLGFTVIRPLPGSPMGRTVLPDVGPQTADGLERAFGTLRPYHVHLAGFELQVDGLAFQQQDQGVSACATTALWSAIQRVAYDERTHIPTPAEITESASRYLLADGRSLPSEGLRVEQICEATRGAGLAPVVVRSVTPEHDRAQLLSYVQSGFPVVLAIQTTVGGHAVCCVGVKLGSVLSQSDASLSFRDGASRVRGIYVHDDRLGPYASAELYPYTLEENGKKRIATGLGIRWLGGVDYEHGILRSMIIPLPPKIRLSVTRMRALGFAVAEGIGTALPTLGRLVTLDACYELGTHYRTRAYQFGLSDAGLYEVECGLTLSRYVGLIEISIPDGPLCDIVLDATEVGANPCALACIRRSALPVGGDAVLSVFAGTLGINLIS